MIENRSDKKLRILETRSEAERSPKSLRNGPSRTRFFLDPIRKFLPRQPVGRFSARYKLRILSRPMAVNRVKWEPYCAEKGSTGRIFRPGASNAQKELCRH